MLRGQNSFPTTELFRKNEDVTRGKVSLHYVPATVPATCPLACAGLNNFLNTTQIPRGQKVDPTVHRVTAEID